MKRFELFVQSVLKALFKINDDELNFEKAVQVATETKEVAMVAKETVYGTSSNVYSSAVAQVSKKRNLVKKHATNSPTINGDARKCYRCGNFKDLAPAYKPKSTTGRYCNIAGHQEIVCRKKAKVSAQRNVQCKQVNNLLNSIDRSPKVECTVSINSQSVRFGVGYGDIWQFHIDACLVKIGRARAERSVHSISVPFRT